MKECFGNYMIYPTCQGHHTCKEYNCFNKTMIEKGACNCLYKGSCHLLRQKLQTEFRENYGYKLEDCDFYQVLKSMYEVKEINGEKEINGGKINE